LCCVGFERGKTKDEGGEKEVKTMEEEMGESKINVKLMGESNLKLQMIDEELLFHAFYMLLSVWFCATFFVTNTLNMKL